MKRPSKQSQRFIEAAREHETDDSPEAFERVFAKIVPPKQPIVLGASKSKGKARK